MNIQELLQENYYIRVEIDTRKKLKGYSLTKDNSPTERTIKCELNRAGYLEAKNKYGFKVKEVETSFLNSIPFADRNKEKTPMMEYYI